MKSESSSKIEPEPNPVRATWDWLLKPLVSSGPSASSDARTRLLAWFLVVVMAVAIALLILVLLVDLPEDDRRRYLSFVLGLVALVALAYCLNRAGHYPMAAGVVVAGALLGPWASVLTDPSILHGDFVPLTYVILSVLLSSILLSPKITTALAGMQMLALLLIASKNPATASVNWPGFLVLIFLISVLGIISGVIVQRNLEQMNLRNRELKESAESYRELSVRDHMTQLFNRRYLEETLAREIQRSDRSHHPIGVVMFDIDQFKQVNDRWGHAAGDAVLQEIGRCAKLHIRGGDIACRYGGDEFVLVLPETSRIATRKRAEQLRETVRQLEKEYEGQDLGTITISLGVASYPTQGSTGEELLKAADKALYRAKSEGGNRLAVGN
ncbi:MAG: GGDEF domain-containing protein [Anaerolineales bacterium]